jgi:hypothetical protein
MPQYRAFKLAREGHVILVDELRCDEAEARQHNFPKYQAPCSTRIKISWLT